MTMEMHLLCPSGIKFSESHMLLFNFSLASFTSVNLSLFHGSASYRMRLDYDWIIDYGHTIIGEILVYCGLSDKFCSSTGFSVLINKRDKQKDTPECSI